MKPSTSSLASGRISPSPLNLTGNDAFHFPSRHFKVATCKFSPLKALSAGALQIGGPPLDLRKCDYLSQPCLKFLGVALGAEGGRRTGAKRRSRLRLILEYGTVL